MKLVRIVCILLISQFSLQAQTEVKSADTIIMANAEASNKVIDKSTLKFYTLDEIKLDNIVIPINTVFSAIVKIVDGRAYLRVTSIDVRDELHTVDWRVLGPDYKEGLPITKEDQSLEVYEDQRVSFRVFEK